MSPKSTPDERFLIQLYHTAMAKGDPYAEVDCQVIAKAIGQKETAIKNIVKHLAQANFLKKGEGRAVYLTERGCQFVELNLPKIKR